MLRYVDADLGHCLDGVRIQADWPRSRTENFEAIQVSRRVFRPTFRLRDHGLRQRQGIVSIFPGGGQRIHHSFEDPAAAPEDQQIDRFRKVRDEIRAWLNEFTGQIAASNRDPSKAGA
jgi:hypothetical protein